MKALGLSVALAALLVSAPTDGVAQTDLSGDWRIEIHSEPGEPRLVLALRISLSQVDQVLTATGVAGNAGPFQMGGSLDESRVHLLLHWDNSQTSENPFGLSLAGTVEEDNMSGSALINRGQRVIRAEWFATRSSSSGA